MPKGDVNDLPASVKAAEHQDGGVYRAILESTDQGYCTIEVAFDEHEKPVDYRFLEVSQSFERQTGIENAAGRWMREIAPGQDQFWFDIYGRVARTGEPERFESFSTPLNRWFSVYALKIDGAARVAVLFDDITDRKRAEDALRASEEQFQALFDQAPLGVYLVDGDFVIRQVNPVALPVFGDIPGGPVGRDFDEVMHILWDKGYADEVIDIFRHTLETGESYVTPERAEYRADRDVIEYYEWRLDRILFSAGRYGVVCYFRDISVQVNARKEIEQQREFAHESEERYRTLFEAIDSGFCILEMIFDEDGRATDYRFLEANPAFERQSGLHDAVGRRIREFAPDLEELWFERYGKVALTGESMRVEGEVAPLGRWFDINAFRVGAPEQRRVAVLFTDVTARCNADRDLRESEERQAFLLKLSDALRAEPSAEAVADRALQMLFEQMGLDRCYVGIYRLEEDRAEIAHQISNDRHPPLPTELRLSDFPKALEVAADRTLVIDNVATMEGLSNADRANLDGLGLRAFVASTLRKGKNYPLWAIVAASAHPRAWTQSEVSLVDEVAERTWAAVERARAEAALRESERSQRLLLAELQHRVRNILAMIQSVVRRTLATSESAEEYASHLRGRIAAMARTQAVLTRNANRQVDLEEAIREELLSVIAPEEQFWCEGPDVALPPRAAEILTLAIHELATNSVKYGAFSGAEGQVEIRWTVETRDAQQWLAFEWEESRVSHGGFHREGFGTELITRRVPYELGGKGTLTPVDDGILATIEFPLQPSSSVLETGMPENVQ